MTAQEKLDIVSKALEHFGKGYRLLATVVPLRKEWSLDQKMGRIEDFIEELTHLFVEERTNERA